MRNTVVIPFVRIATSFPEEIVLPGLRLRQARERLGFTYRDGERASHELAAREDSLN